MIAGIVCEYNPFHKGHLYQLNETKKSGADAVVCVMSGNYVQRGECAFLDKWKRAEIAVRSGADVVIDLPVPWAVSSAEDFARGSIFLLKQFGVDVVSFGSESENREQLLLASESIGNEDVLLIVREKMSQGISYPSALCSAVEQVYGKDIADILSSPNSTLAVEYIRQIKKFGDMDFLPVKRRGAGHDSDDTKAEFLSASALREFFNSYSYEKAMPYLSPQGEEILKKAFSDKIAPCSMKANERGILTHLRSLSKAEIEKYISDENGLASRIYEGIRNAGSLDELYSLSKSRNYTHSRVRREILNAFLGVEKDLSKGNPPYMRILAVNEKGLTLLSSAKKNSAIPIVTKHGEMQNLDLISEKLYNLQCSSTDKFALFSPEIRECGLEQKNSMLIIK